MNFLGRFAAIGLGLLVCGLFGIVLFKIASGRIVLVGLLSTKLPGGHGSAFSSARLQLLIFTVVVAAHYLHAVIVNPHVDALPHLSQGVVAALGGSQAVYLGGKALTALKHFLTNLK